MTVLMTDWFLGGEGALPQGAHSLQRQQPVRKDPSDLTGRESSSDAIVLPRLLQPGRGVSRRREEELNDPRENRND